MLSNGLVNEDGFDAKWYGKLSSPIYKLAKSHQSPDSPIRIYHKDSRYLRNPGVEGQVTAGDGFYQIEHSKLGEKGIVSTVKMEIKMEIAGIFYWFVRQDGPLTVGECKKNFSAVPATNFKELFARAEESGFLKKLWFVEL